MGVVEESKRSEAAVRGGAMADLLPTVERAVRLIVGAGSPHAEDAVLLAIDRDLRQVRDPEAARAWAHRVATRCAVRLARRERRRALVGLASPPPPRAVEGIDSTLGTIIEAFDRLPPRMRAVAVLRLYVGLSEQETAVAAQRVVLQPLGVFGLDPRYGPVRDRDFIVSLNANGASPKVTHAGLVLQRREAGGEVRVYATTNVDGSHGIGISEDANPPGLGCCASEADLAAPVHVGLQLSRSVDPVSLSRHLGRLGRFAHCGGRGDVQRRQHAAGRCERRLLPGGRPCAAGAQPVALIARAADGSELGRLAISRG